MTQVTSRELELLRQLATFRYLHGGQVEALLFDGSPFGAETRETLARRVLGPLRRSGQVAVRPRPVGGSGGGSARQVYLLTNAGRRVLAAATGGAPGQRSSRGTLFVDHALALADVAIAFRRAATAHPGHAVLAWDADWELAAAFSGSALRPDARLAYATPACELAAFVELDRDTERPVAFARKVTRYLDVYQNGAWRQRLHVWPTILTVTPSVVRATSLRRTTEAVLDARYDGEAVAAVTEFRFAAAPHLAEAAGPLGAIWQVAGRDGLHPLLERVDADPRAAEDSEARGVAIIRRYWDDAP